MVAWSPHGFPPHEADTWRMLMLPPLSTRMDTVIVTRVSGSATWRAERSSDERDRMLATLLMMLWSMPDWDATMSLESVDATCDGHDHTWPVWKVGSGSSNCSSALALRWCWTGR